jgi:hypothetical protein
MTGHGRSTLVRFVSTLLGMSVGGVSGSGSAASYLSSPAVQMAQLQGSALSTLFAPTTGEPSDLSSFTSTAVSSTLFTRPGLLTGLTQWDGSMTPGSQRTAAPAPSGTPADTAAASPAAPKSPFTFNPFDQASWDVDSKGHALDTSA